MTQFGRLIWTVSGKPRFSLRWMPTRITIIAFSLSTSEHIEHVHVALETLGKEGISLKIDKFDLFTKKVKYLGRIVRPGTKEIDEAKSKCLE